MSTVQGLRVFIFTGVVLVLSGTILARVFSGSVVLPQSLELGPITIRYYGLIMASAVMSGYFFALRRSGKYGLSKTEAERLIFWAVVLGFVGARLYHVASSWQYYSLHPLDIVKVWNGGLGIFGALFGGLIVTLLVCIYREKLFPGKTVSLLRLLDWGAPAFLLGQIIGRFGNLFNYEAFGYPTSLPWKMFVPENFRPFDSLSSQFYHPLFLYEALGNVVILTLFLAIQKKYPAERLPAGTLFFSYLFLYNVLRFFIEFLRVDSTFIGEIRLNSVTSFVLAAAGCAGLCLIFWKKYNHARQISQDN